MTETAPAPQPKPTPSWRSTMLPETGLTGRAARDVANNALALAQSRPRSPSCGRTSARSARTARNSPRRTGRACGRRRRGLLAAASARCRPSRRCTSAEAHPEIRDHDSALAPSAAGCNPVNHRQAAAPAVTCAFRGPFRARVLLIAGLAAAGLSIAIVQAIESGNPAAGWLRKRTGTLPRADLAWE